MKRPRTILAVPIALLVLGGCATQSRPALTDADLQVRSRADAQESREIFKDAIDRMVDRAAHPRVRVPGGRPEMDFLAISGGGDWGAFGAGFLVGWGEVADPRWRRPDFDVVTGVSTGALLAPFAYIGTDEAYLQVEEFYRNPKPNWVQKRGMLFFLPSNPSFMAIPGLEHDIRSAVDERFISELADQSRAGKLLVVSATNLDLGRQRFWNVGAEAERAQKSGDRDRVARMMLASSAIPAAFPPVEIDDFLYGDGGVTANVFLRLDPSDPEGFIARWQRDHPAESLPKIRYWIIFNNQLTHAPKTVQCKWPAVMEPSLATSVRSATIAEIRWLSAQAGYVNMAFHTDIEVRVVAIPNDWRPPVEGTFKKETMESLCDLGRRMGADPASWADWGTPVTGETEPPPKPVPQAAR